MANVYQSDIGTMVLVDLGSVVIYEEDQIFLNVRKPDLSEEIWDASIYSASNPTQVYYLSDQSSFDQAGKYLLQAELVKDDGSRWLGNVATFDVKVRWA